MALFFSLWFYACVAMANIMVSEALKVFEDSLSPSNYKLFYHRSADFGPPSPLYNVTGKLRLMHNATACNIEEFRQTTTDGTGSNYEQVYTNDIVLILRGSCTFSTKVYHAQRLGAIGVVVGNYLQNGTNGEEWVVMSRDDDDTHIVVIPSVFVPHSTYQWLYNSVLSYSGHDDDGDDAANEDIYAMLDADGEYVAPSNTFWIAIFGVVIIVIPTLWCVIVCLALVRKRLLHYIQRTRRRQHLTTIPVILYGKNKPNPVGVDLTQAADVGGNNDLARDEPISSVYAKMDSAQPEEQQKQGERKDSTASALDNDTVDTAAPVAAAAVRKLSVMSEFLISSFRAKKAYYAPHNDSCAICLEDYRYGEALRLLPCNHAFHTRCIDPWLSKQSELCPMCKQSIFMNANHSEAAGHNGQRLGCLTKLCCITRRRNADAPAAQSRSNVDNNEVGHDNDDSHVQRRRRRRRPRVHINGGDDGNLAMIHEEHNENDENGVIVLGHNGELVPIESDSNHSDHAENDISS